MRPRVGLTTLTATVDGDRSLALPRAYVASVIRAGGSPVPLMIQDPAQADFVLNEVDGLIVIGGDDVCPASYGEAPHPTVTVCDPDRDEWELTLTRRALQKGLPVLGLCRGHQVINVALGGTLVQDLPTQAPSPVDHNPRVPMDQLAHEIRLSDSWLKRLWGLERVEVNSFHHQAIRTLASGLKAVAWSSDGVIEGLEGTGASFLVGVQFHPETLDAPPFTQLFEAFVSVCRER